MRRYIAFPVKDSPLLAYYQWICPNMLYKIDSDSTSYLIFKDLQRFHSVALDWGQCQLDFKTTYSESVEMFETFFSLTYTQPMQKHIVEHYIQGAFSQPWVVLLGTSFTLQPDPHTDKSVTTERYYKFDSKCTQSVIQDGNSLHSTIRESNFFETYYKQCLPGNITTHLTLTNRGWEYDEMSCSNKMLKEITQNKQVAINSLTGEDIRLAWLEEYDALAQQLHVLLSSDTPHKLILSETIPTLPFARNKLETYDFSNELIEKHPALEFNPYLLLFHYHFLLIQKTIDYMEQPSYHHCYLLILHCWQIATDDSFVTREEKAAEGEGATREEFVQYQKIILRIINSLARQWQEIYQSSLSTLLEPDVSVDALICPAALFEMSSKLKFAISNRSFLEKKSWDRIFNIIRYDRFLQQMKFVETQPFEWHHYQNLLVYLNNYIDAVAVVEDKAPDYDASVAQFLIKIIQRLFIQARQVLINAVLENFVENQFLWKQHPIEQTFSGLLNGLYQLRALSLMRDIQKNNPSSSSPNSIAQVVSYCHLLQLIMDNLPPLRLVVPVIDALVKADTLLSPAMKDFLKRLLKNIKSAPQNATKLEENLRHIYLDALYAFAIAQDYRKQALFNLSLNKLTERILILPDYENSEKIACANEIKLKFNEQTETLLTNFHREYPGTLPLLQALFSEKMVVADVSLTAHPFNLFRKLLSQFELFKGNDSAHLGIVMLCCHDMIQYLKPSHPLISPLKDWLETTGLRLRAFLNDTADTRFDTTEEFYRYFLSRLHNGENTKINAETERVAIKAEFDIIFLEANQAPKLFLRRNSQTLSPERVANVDATYKRLYQYYHAILFPHLTLSTLLPQRLFFGQRTS